MTRQRMGRSLQAMTFQDCPYCHGEGQVRSPSTVSIEVFRKLKKLLNESRQRAIEVAAHPDVANFLLTQDKALVSFIESRYRRRIKIRPDQTRHIEDIHFSPV